MSATVDEESSGPTGTAYVRKGTDALHAIRSPRSIQREQPMYTASYVLGVDVGKRSLAVCLRRSADQQIILETSIDNETAAIQQLLQAMPVPIRHPCVSQSSRPIPTGSTARTRRWPQDIGSCRHHQGRQSSFSDHSISSQERTDWTPRA